MPSLNKVLLMGHVGREPNIKAFNSGRVMASFSMATSKKIKEEFVSEWHEVVCWEKAAEFCSKINKGDLVFVEGEIKTVKYVDKNGANREDKKINAVSVRLLKKPEKKEFSPTQDKDILDIKEFLGAEEIPF